MKINLSPEWLCRGLAVAFVMLATVTFLRAQSVTGTIEGRVLNATNGEYLQNARLTVEGGSLETFTDSDGNFRLTNVPMGTARVRAFFTGLAVQTAEVPIVGGQTVRRDFSLSTSAGAAESVVKLSAFVVGTSREMDGTAIAINEQRFAANIKNVFSSDEFGGVAEGNVAEVLKFMPGVTVDTSGGNMRFISINGVSSDNVPVMIDGFNLASAAGTATNRSVQVDMVSINNLARVEVTYSPTPESPGAALAGTVNMIPRSSFERTKPVFNGSAYIMMRDNARDFRRVPGPKATPTPNVHPGFDFSYVAPISKRFGFTLSGGHSTQYSAQDIVTLTWRGGGTATNGTTFPHTAFDKPYLSTFAVLDGPKVTARNSFGGTIDFKLTPNDRFAFTLQYSSFDVYFRNTTLTFNVGAVAPGNFSVASVRGSPGAGDLVLDRAFRHRFNETLMPTLTWRHDGPVWKADAGAGMSHATDENLSTSAGFLRTSVARRAAVTVAFDDIFYLRPRAITVTDGVTGAPVDPYNLNNYVVTSGTNAQDGSVDV
ncbi:MAG: TonB-dependent receptor [Opitutus sp.]|nr:TonB-dependent receptor [Opitutus sp.]